MNTPTGQRSGKVVFVERGSKYDSDGRRSFIGTVRSMEKDNRRNSRLQLIPSSSRFPKFTLPPLHRIEDYDTGCIYGADYTYGSWDAVHRWPSVENLRMIGRGGSPEAETKALKIEFGVDHKDYDEEFPEIMKEVHENVKDGMRDIEGTDKVSARSNLSPT